MNISINNTLPFESKIKFVKEFPCYDDKIRNLCRSKTFVDYPWTVETMKTGTNLNTYGVKDCFVIALTDGEDSALMHLANWTEEEAEDAHVNKFDIENIKKVLTEKYDLTKKNIHGLILGGWQNDDKFGLMTSTANNYNALMNFFKEQNIPMSVICQRKDVTRDPYDSNGPGRYAMLYKEDEDTFYITNTLTRDQCYSNWRVYEVDINSGMIEYSEFEKVYNTCGSYYYKETRKKASIEDYLKSQFEFVFIRPEDELILGDEK